jgi:predicted DNA-binding transcriptional regulator AlpA
METTKTNAPNQQRDVTQILGVQEVADRLGIPKSSVYEKTRFRGANGQAPLPCRRVGRYLKFLAADVEQWLLSIPLSVNRTKRPYHRKKKAAK